MVRPRALAVVTVFLHDHVALLDRNVARLGGDLNRGLADLGEEQLINLICREAALIARRLKRRRHLRS